MRGAVKLPPRPESMPATNTTIGVIATDAILTKAQAHKVAQMAHDGMARAIRPTHTLFEGDTIFCMATGRRKLPEIPGYYGPMYAQAVSDIGHAAAKCMSRAIISAILTAKSMAGMTAFWNCGYPIPAVQILPAGLVLKSLAMISLRI